MCELWEHITQLIKSSIWWLLNACSLTVPSRWRKVLWVRKHLICRLWMFGILFLAVLMFAGLLCLFLVPSENVSSISACASVIEGVSRSRNALLNGDTRNYDWDSGYTCHQLGSGAIVIQLAQPYIISSLRY